MIGLHLDLSISYLEVQLLGQFSTGQLHSILRLREILLCAFFSSTKMNALVFDIVHLMLNVIRKVVYPN